MGDVEQYATELLATFRDIQKLSKKIRSTSEWSVEQVIESVESLFARFCPYQVGDRVELSQHTLPDEGSGWFGCRQFLMKGSPGVVSSRGYRGEQFTFNITFDLESWRDDGYTTKITTIRPVRNRHTFHFSERSLVPTDKPEAVFGSGVVEPAWFADVVGPGLSDALIWEWS